MIKADPMVVSILVGTVIPFIVGLITKVNASIKVKVIANALVSLVAMYIANSTIAETGAAVFSWKSLSMFVVTTLTSGQAYDKFWSPVLDINSRAGLLPDKGFGGGGE